jgi:hypothetical protein
MSMLKPKKKSAETAKKGQWGDGEELGSREQLNDGIFILRTHRIEIGYVVGHGDRLLVTFRRE